MKNDIKDPAKSGVKQKRFSPGLPVRQEHAAGIDIGDSKHDVAVSDGMGGHEVREYRSFTADMEDLVKWLSESGIRTVAMESTGVYWLNLYLMLEEAGIEPYLVNARHVKNVTGRKRDDTDAIWLQKLHSCGLLQKSFQPDGDIRTLRTYVRQRRRLIERRSDSVRHMQKSLELMNIKLHVVISDLVGKTGLLMVEAILSGKRDPRELVKLKDRRIKASEEDLLKSLKGIWKEEYLFMLDQAYQCYKFYQSQINSCEEKIKGQLLMQAAAVMEGDVGDVWPVKKKAPKRHGLSFTAGPALAAIMGTDVCEIEGISEVTALELVSETGSDMGKWKDYKHFSAWLNLAPNTKITGGKIISSKMQRKKNKAGLTVRMAASTLSNSKSPLGDYYRKMRARLGKKGAVVATGHKIARIIYTMVKEGRPYDKDIITKNQQQWKERRIMYLEKQLVQLKKAS